MSMNRRILILASWLAGAVALVPVSLAVAQVQAAAPPTPPTFNVLHAFDGPSINNQNYSGLTMSGDGGYVGTVSNGGAFGQGMVYKLAADGSVTSRRSMESTSGASSSATGLSPIQGKT